MRGRPYGQASPPQHHGQVRSCSSDPGHNRPPPSDRCWPGGAAGTFNDATAPSEQTPTPAVSGPSAHRRRSAGTHGSSEGGGRCWDSPYPLPLNVENKKVPSTMGRPGKAPPPGLSARPARQTRLPGGGRLVLQASWCGAAGGSGHHAKQQEVRAGAHGGCTAGGWGRGPSRDGEEESGSQSPWSPASETRQVSTFLRKPVIGNLLLDTGRGQTQRPVPWTAPAGSHGVRRTEKRLRASQQQGQQRSRPSWVPAPCSTADRPPPGHH